MLVKIVLFFFIACSICAVQAFQPQNKHELKSAVDACIADDPMGMGCTKDGVHISKWDVSKVTDMSDMFHMASSFNGDLSSWDVSQDRAPLL